MIPTTSYPPNRLASRDVVRRTRYAGSHEHRRGTGDATRSAKPACRKEGHHKNHNDRHGPPTIDARNTTHACPIARHPPQVARQPRHETSAATQSQHKASAQLQSPQRARNTPADASNAREERRLTPTHERQPRTTHPEHTQWLDTPQRRDRSAQGQEGRKGSMRNRNR